MRILFFPQALGQGGVERSIAYLAHGLSQHGHPVAVAALHSISAGWEQILDPAAWPVSIFFRETPGHAWSAGGQLVSAICRLRRLLQTARIECLYCTGGPAPRVVGWLATRRLPAVRLVWNQQALSHPRPFFQSPRDDLLRRFTAGISPTVPLMISCSDAVRRSYQAAGYRCQRHVVVYNGIDVERFRPDAAAGRAIRSEWGIAPEHKLVGLVGRLDPVKGHAVFLEAAALMAREREGLWFVCVGDGPEPYRGELRRLGAELGLGARLIWAGARAYGDLPAVYNALDALCLSSHREGLPNVLGEAMACGVPCVATRVGGVPEVMGDCGLTVPPGDPPALAHGVLATLRVDPRPAALRAHIVDGFSAEAMLGATERELAAVTGGGADVAAATPPAT